MSPSSRRARRRSPRACCATTGASASRCSRRWWSRSKGYYTDLAKWAAKKGFKTPARRRRQPFHERSGRGCRASRSTRSSCRSPRSTSASKTDTALHAALARALDFGKGLVHVLGRSRDAATVFSTKRACPSCGRSFAELDPRLFSFNSKHGWCESCFGTGVEMARLRRRADRRGDRVERLVRRRCAAAPAPACDGQRLNPVALNVRFRDRSIAALAAEPVGAAARVLQQAASSTPREQRDRARPADRDPLPAEVPGARRAGLSAARPLRAHALGRRGAAHPPGRAARLESAGRVLRARRADHRPAPARQRHPARLARRAGADIATRWSSSSTTRTPSAAPTTCSISAPAPACAAARSSARAP